jgi:hypothetical protein
MEEKSPSSRTGGVSDLPTKIGRRGRRGLTSLVLALLVGAWASGCTPSTNEEAWTASDVIYARRDAQLFDDLFRPELFGVEHTVEPPERDPRLTERTVVADSVCQAKVITVTRGGVQSGASYTIVLRPEPKPLSGRKLPETLTLVIFRSSPTFAWLEATEKTWVGTRVVLFARAFIDGLHYHATTDTPAVRKAIEQAAVMNSLVQ